MGLSGKPKEIFYQIVTEVLDIEQMLGKITKSVITQKQLIIKSYYQKNMHSRVKWPWLNMEGYCLLFTKVLVLQSTFCDKIL